MSRQRDLAEAASFCRRRLVHVCLRGDHLDYDLDLPDAWRPVRRLVGGLVATAVLVAGMEARQAYLSDSGSGRVGPRTVRVTPSPGP